MSWLGSVVSGLERREGLQSPSQFLLDLFGSGTHAGRSVTVNNSMELVAVFAAVQRIAGSIGSLPLMVYRRLDVGRERAENHRAWSLLHDQPNPEMASDEVWQLVGAHLLLWGNAFLAKVRSNTGVVSELWPMRPDRVQVGKGPDGRRYFIVDGGSARFGEEDILHIRGLGTDGLVGLSPIQQTREMIAAGMSLEEFTGRFWASSANPAGVLKHPNKLSKDAQDRLRANWKAQQGGVRNAGEVAILEEGMEWQNVSLPLKDAQFIETAEFGHRQVALIFGLPPHMLAAKSGDSLTYSSTEMEGLEYVRWTLRPWLVRIESALQRDPSIFVQGQRFYPEFLADALLRSTTKERFEAWQLALDPAKGWMDRDEVRERENLPVDQTEPPPDPQPSPAPPGA